MFVYYREPVHNMHRARRSREKDDADNRPPRGGLLRAAISSAPHSSCGIFERLVPLEQARAVTAERSAALWWFQRHPSSILGFLGRLERHLSRICGSGVDSSGTRRAFCDSRASSSNVFRAFCGFRAGSSGHFEPAVAFGQAPAVICSKCRHFLRQSEVSSESAGVCDAKMSR